MRHLRLHRLVAADPYAPPVLAEDDLSRPLVQWLMRPGATETLTLEQLLRRPGWMAAGACRGEPLDTFFPVRGEPTDRVKALCRRCPVRRECADYAHEHPDLVGIWGGLSQKERRQKRARKAS